MTAENVRDVMVEGMFEKAKKRRVFHHGLDIAYSDLECSMRFVL